MKCKYCYEQEVNFGYICDECRRTIPTEEEEEIIEEELKRHLMQE